MYSLFSWRATEEILCTCLSNHSLLLINLLVSYQLARPWNSFQWRLGDFLREGLRSVIIDVPVTEQKIPLPGGVIKFSFWICEVLIHTALIALEMTENRQPGWVVSTISTFHCVLHCACIGFREEDRINTAIENQAGPYTVWKIDYISVNNRFHNSRTSIVFCVCVSINVLMWVHIQY